MITTVLMSPERELENPLLINRISFKYSCDSSILQYRDAITERDEFFQFRRVIDDAFSLNSKLLDYFINPSLGPDIHSSRRITKQEDRWITSQPFSNNDFLLVASAQPDDRLTRTRDFNGNRRDKILHNHSFPVALNEPEPIC